MTLPPPYDKRARDLTEEEARNVRSTPQNKMNSTHTVSRMQLIAALHLAICQLQLYCGQHDTGTKQILAECQLILRLSKSSK